MFYYFTMSIIIINVQIARLFDQIYYQMANNPRLVFTTVMYAIWHGLWLILLKFLILEINKKSKY